MTMIPCIVIPVFDHADRLERSFPAILGFGLPVIVVDDGSESSHQAKLDALTRRNKAVTLVAHERNQGKGAAVKTGLRTAAKMGFTHAVQIDADGQHNIEDLPLLLDLARKHQDALIAGQPVYDVSIPRSRLIGRYITHFWVWIETLSFDIKDSMCGFRVYPLQTTLSVIDGVPTGSRMDFDIEILVRLYWKGVKILPVPTNVTYPEGAVSHFRMLEDNVLISKMHTKLFFGMLFRLPLLLWRKAMPQQAL